VPVKIFLSYARGDDEAFVKRFYEGLTAKGFDVWFDRVSVPSRSLTFSEEIADAIAASDRLVLVVGPKAIESDYVTAEWRFAHFKAVICTNPIVRCNGNDAVDGYGLIPEDLRGPHIEDFRKDEEFDFHLEQLARQLNDPLPPLGKLVAVPQLPDHYFEQRDRLKQLRDMLLIDLGKPVVISGAKERVGIQGMPGIGKSQLAAGLAHRPEIQRAFPDGVYWVTIGQKPEPAALTDRLRWLVHELGGAADFPNLETGKEKLRGILKDRKALLVLDDVWEREPAEVFNVLGPRCRMLLTTRDAGLVTAMAGNQYQVQRHSDDDARHMLARAAKLPPVDLPPEAADIIAKFDNLPLAMVLSGGMVQGGTRWDDILENLRRHRLDRVRDEHQLEEQHRDLDILVEMSVRVLPELERERFFELAVFPIDTGAPEAAVATLWEHTGGLDDVDARDLLTRLVRRSLVQRPGAGRMELHDVLHDFAFRRAITLCGSVAGLHVRLVDAYAKKCPSGWPSGPNDSYFQQYLVRHLLAAERTDDAVALLTDLPWIEAKCKTGLAFDLQEDYRLTIAVLPEAREELREGERRQAEVARWAATQLECGRQKRLPRPDEIPNSLGLWSEERIAAECRRIVENPTRLDRVKAFSGFVDQDLYLLNEFGKHPGFVVQQGFNSGSAGPVHRASAQQLHAPALLRRWSVSEVYNPRPALRRTLEGHRDWVTSVAVTSNGRYVVSGSYDHTLKVWDLSGREAVRTLEGHTGVVKCLSVTPDGRRAVSASADKTLKVWDLSAGKAVFTLEGHTGEVTSLRVTPDGRRAVSASVDNTLKLWDLSTGIPIRTMDLDRHCVFSMAVTPDGQHAVSPSQDNTLKVWDLSIGKAVRTLDGHTNHVSDVAVTPDGQHAVSVSGHNGHNTIKVWDLSTGEAVDTMEGHSRPLFGVYRFGVYRVAVTPDGQHAVSAQDDTIELWNLSTGRAMLTLEGHTDRVLGIAVTPDGQHVVSASQDNTLKVWDLNSGRTVTSLNGHTGEIYCVAVTPDGEHAVSARADDTIEVCDLKTEKAVRRLKGHTDGVLGVAVTPDGRHAVSASKDKTLRVWKLSTEKSVHTLRGHTDWVAGVAVTPNGQHAVSGSWDRTLKLWDLTSGQLVRTLRGHTDGVLGVAVTPDGRQAVSASLGGTLKVWDLSTGRAVLSLESHTDSVWSVAVTPTGQNAVSASEDNTLKLWDLSTGKAVSTMVGHTNRVKGVAVTPDGQRAVSASEDKMLKVWGLRDGRCLATVRLNRASQSVAITAHNRIVVGTDAGVLFFDLHMPQ
jgi:WD40 repeat protein